MYFGFSLGIFPTLFLNFSHEKIYELVFFTIFYSIEASTNHLV
ncbi:TPA_asm: hypothetical protein HUJ06_000163 [Nelumbo nucifera]|uniref:Uncharacterized protein n=1 Tax=Nelumbo nucifera TaxID=4432 RepID=A0A822XSL0_NELNU|nr:TPA_asm: hypothetical protein HUJ06_026058 [Nelumbo nucifera]DAD49564.1 TPA_asm: hypothetical protein HUJ06_000163 [Nelumbo nucifera]